MHRGWVGWRRGIFDRCEADQGRRGQEQAVVRRSAEPITWPKALEASRAVREYLAVLDAAPQ